MKQLCDVRQIHESIEARKRRESLGVCRETVCKFSACRDRNARIGRLVMAAKIIAGEFLSHQEPLQCQIDELIEAVESVK